MAPGSTLTTGSADSASAPTSPFTPKQLARLDEALTLGSRETGLQFSVYVGELGDQPRHRAEELHAGLGARGPESILIAVSPAQRRLEIVTGEQVVKRLPDRACALAALSMTASFTGGDLVGGIVNGLRMLADSSGHPLLLAT